MNIASLEQTRTTHAFLSFPGQSYSGTSFQVKSAWQSYSIPSRPKSRRSSTLDSIRPKHFFYLFAFLLLYFLLSFQFPTTLTHLFLYLFYHFPSRTPLVIILKLRAYQYTGKKPRYQVSVYRTICPLVSGELTKIIFSIIIRYTS